MSRLGRWLEDRTGIPSRLVRVATHRVPPRTGWRYVFGSALLAAFGIQVATGIALATVYVPSTSQAYESLRFISHDAAFGHLLRGMHYFGAGAMILLLCVHAARVFLTGSYKFPREVNWLTGVGLFGLVVLMGFTGQLLRWDQNAVWSAVVAAEQAGRVPVFGQFLAHLLLAGDRLGGATLSRFFAFHVFFVPAIIFAFIGVHVWLALRNGVSEPPEVTPWIDRATYRRRYATLVETRGHSFWPDAAWRDATAGVLVMLVVVLLAQWSGAPPLGRPPDPSIITASPRPDWYFLWYFALLAVLPKHVEQPYFIVLAPLVAAIAMVALPFVRNAGERRPSRRPVAMLVVAAAIGVVGYFCWLGERAPWVPDFTDRPIAASTLARDDSTARAGAAIFHDRDCESCHSVAGQGGHRGPDLTDVADRLDRAQIVSRVLGGAQNMPAYVGKLSASDLDALVAFLEQARRRAGR